MNTPVLTKRQQRHSLSAKKTPVKGLRNVLGQPQDNYWPLVHADKCPILENLLKKLMPMMKRPTLTMPWSQLKHMKKEERLEAKRKALSEHMELPDKDIMDAAVLGLNAVTRSLENNNVCCILLDANIDPPLLIKHIILMAQNKNIPILLLPALKVIMLNSIGFPSAAFALKNLVMESKNHKFQPLYSSICTIFKDIPAPKNVLQLFKNIETLEESALYQSNEAALKSETKAKGNPLKVIEFTLSTNVYKYRSSCKERAFIPQNAKNLESMDKTQCNDFISLCNYDSDNETKVKTFKSSRFKNIHENVEETKVKYLPLKVKRLQGNSNRIKATKITKQKKNNLMVNFYRDQTCT